MKKQIKEIINITRFIFDDSEYKIIKNYIKNDKYDDIIAFIDEQIDLYEILLSFENDKNSEIPAILEKLTTLKDLSENIYLGKSIT